MRISFVGAGNVAWHLAQALENAGHHIVEIYSRDARTARRLVNKLYDTHIAPDLDFSESVAELLILAVSDDALTDVVSKLVLPENCTVIHTSGSKSLSELQNLIGIYSDITVATGVFYPLQTFSKEVEIQLTDVPICIESTDTTTEKMLVQLAQDISNVVYLMTSEERRLMHLGAVFACNFTNHLLAIAKRIVEAEHLEFDLLKPLIRETLRKALLSADPALVQTGPARRGDQQTLDIQLDYLERYPAWQGIYEVLSESIQRIR